MTRKLRLASVMLLLLVSALILSESRAAANQNFKLNENDHVCYIGNTLADRMQHHGWLETYIQALHPKHQFTFRNLGFAGDELNTRPRSANFGSPDQWLTKEKADVVFCFFGYNESLRGESAVAGFGKNLANMIDSMKKQKYNGKSAPRLVIFSPIAHENLKSRHLPDGIKNNKNLKLYTAAMKKVCTEKKVTFVDLFTTTSKLYAAAEKPLTMNGVHLLDRGNKALAAVIVDDLFGGLAKLKKIETKEIMRLRQAVLDKNYHWFSRYRVVDGYNVYGGRSRLAWHKQSNADVMRREMEMFDVMTANRDKKVWAVAQGSDLKVKDNNLPKGVVVKTNKPGKLKDEKHPYLSDIKSMQKFKLAKGMQANVFASEKMFPELINPVQMAVDPDGRLFASVWPSYPHWNPTQPRRDRIVCLPDENGDGVADKCVIFADKLNSITGFEFWGGGMLVAAPPEIWFLKDTTGDGKADYKLRVLQGISSADTHHTANAMVIGTDGWLYWSRGVFNTANMETPTKTYRSRTTGVHRFNPRTYEVEFHYPIGPNPHGDVIDQWGYQFVNDGTGGTGCYANIGKGVRNKLWFKKRVRPVAATGILSSSHFPPENDGNFLICNTIGFLGVLQHKFVYNGADITAKEIEPILVSSDPNFRPTDVEVGGDGALYVSDWCNVLIGHMQHNMRDPNRDHEHGRIYRITYKGRPLVKRVKMRGKPIAEVCQLGFYAKENSTRYRARLELSGRNSDEVAKTVGAWASKLNIAKADDAQAMLECLWVFEEHRIPNMNLLKRVFQAKEPRVRAAAIRTMGHWASFEPSQVKNWQTTLIAAAKDSSALVRAEAVKAAVEFQGLDAAEVIFIAATKATDPELEFVLRYATSKLKIEQIVRDAIRSGKPMSTAAQTYVLRNASVADLRSMKPTEAVYRAILSRGNASASDLIKSLEGLAAMKKLNQLDLLLSLIQQRDAAKQGGLAPLGVLLAKQNPQALKKVKRKIAALAIKGQAAETRQMGYVAWIVATGSAEDAFLSASKSKARLQDFLAAISSVPSKELRGNLYPTVRSLVLALPANLKPELGGGGLQQQGVIVDYFSPHSKDVKLETLAKRKPLVSSITPQIRIVIPQGQSRDGFALRFTAMLQVPKTGRYTFFTNSDDGSRLYIDKKLVVNNDGPHGMIEKRGRVRLTAGSHQIVVTYFDSGGGDGLSVAWSGKGMKKQPIATKFLSISGGETLHDVAIRTLAFIPGHEKDKILTLSSLVKAGKNRVSAISILRGIPINHWSQNEVQPMVDNLVSYLTELPAKYRTNKAAMQMIALTKSLTAKLPEDRQKAIISRLANLNVRVIAIGTVPHRMLYDKELIVVKPGQDVEFRFSNSDAMPHNFCITLPGAMKEIGELAEATAIPADEAMARYYIPKSDKIIFRSELLQPGKSQILPFKVPSKPGIYPYVCTYPGHWRRMYGALYVVNDPAAYKKNPAEYLAKNNLKIQDELLHLIGKSVEWKIADLLESVNEMKAGRSFAIGENAFKVSSCISCHRMGKKVGQQFGPDLTKLMDDNKKHSVRHILESLIEPSKKIDEKYQTAKILLNDGTELLGMIVKETDKEIHVIQDPLAKKKMVIIKRGNEDDELDQYKKLNTSIMPIGLANKLTREEILDLIAYVYSAANKKHPLFKGGHDHNHGHNKKAAKHDH